MRITDVCKAGFVFAALMGALAVTGASAVIPIPVDTSKHDNGVYVQPVHAPNRGPIISCRVHVFTQVDGVGETMTAQDGDGNDYSDEVNGVSQPGTRDVVAGRAVFVVPPGTELTTTNTSPTVSATCPVE